MSTATKKQEGSYTTNKKVYTQKKKSCYVTSSTKSQL